MQGPLQPASVRPRLLHRRRLRLAVMGLSCLMFAAPALAGGPEGDRHAQATLAVSGEGTAMARPDMAVLSAAVVCTGATGGEAVAANSAAMTKVLAALEAAGVATADIATSGFSVQPRFAPPRPDGQPEPDGPRITGYEVRNAVTVRVRHLDALGSVLDRLVGAGANEIGGLSMTFAEPDKLADAARRDAVADARRKAETYAAAAGVRLGRVLRLSERGLSRPEPMAMMMRADMAKASAAVPVASGEQSVEAGIDVVFEIER